MKTTEESESTSVVKFIASRASFKKITELPQLSIKNGIVQYSRVLAWDNQRIFGPALEDESSPRNADVELA